MEQGGQHGFHRAACRGRLLAGERQHSLRRRPGGRGQPPLRAGLLPALPAVRPAGLLHLVGVLRRALYAHPRPEPAGRQGRPAVPRHIPRQPADLHALPEPRPVRHGLGAPAPARAPVEALRVRGLRDELPRLPRMPEHHRGDGPHPRRLRRLRPRLRQVRHARGGWPARAPSAAPRRAAGFQGGLRGCRGAGARGRGPVRALHPGLPARVPQPRGCPDRHPREARRQVGHVFRLGQRCLRPERRERPDDADLAGAHRGRWPEHHDLFWRRRLRVCDPR
mmetsp:Transcript_11389/g.30394  ORF Transcript_11389/g.30394 Transcript_11389/m.30394 type:complete len:279 (-) Transcript_11389:577-1413(-)